MSKPAYVWLCLLLGAMAPSGTGEAQTSASSTAIRPEEVVRETYQRVPDILEAMRVRTGSVVADVGAGGGFLTVRLARAVGSEGHVFAIDIDARALERLRTRVQQEGLVNAEVIEGKADDPLIAPASLDAAVIVNAYHEMHAHQAMLHQLRRALKPEGRLVIVEPLSENRRHETREAQIQAHEIALQFVEDDVRDAGFRVVRTEDPFTVQGPVAMSLLVAAPEKRGTASSDTPASRAPTPLPPADDSAALNDPDLRVSPDRFEQLRNGNRIIVVDVRTGVEYRSGHIPGAISIPLDRLGEEMERLIGLRKPIVTYCS